ncbi:hypothetical protein Csa_001202 [Cucumis sativus]|nr:hypothetical protein Csa_001202 [Cucumis sativus]
MRSAANGRRWAIDDDEMRRQLLIYDRPTGKGKTHTIKRTTCGQKVERRRTIAHRLKIPVSSELLEVVADEREADLAFMYKREIWSS